MKQPEEIDMKLFFNNINHFSSSPLVRALRARLQSLCRGAFICLKPWLYLIPALFAGITPAYAASGGTVLWEVRDSKAGMQMPTIPTGSVFDGTNNYIYIT